MSKPKVVITGTGAVCAAGRTPQEILEAVRAGRSAIGPIRQWDSSGWPTRMAGEIADLNPREMVEDRKLHKLIRRTDLFGLYAAARVIDAAGLAAYRDSLAPEAAAQYNDRTGVYVGSGGGNYDSQYDYFPLMTEANDALPAFGRELANTVNPMWLLRTLPNNVLGHIGIRHGFKGSNACITNHSIGGTLAVIEATEALRNGEADRALAVGHDAPIEPQMVLYYADVGLLASETIRPFDHRHDGSLFGEGAAALALETETSAAARGATLLGEVLGGGSASDAQGLLAIRDDGDALARAIALALDDAGLSPGDVGMIAAHGNGTPQSDASEALAIRRIFGANGASAPPTTAFKWSFGHLIAAAGILDAVLALHALREGLVPGVATFESLDPVCEGVPVSHEPQRPRSDVALVLCRGFAGTNAALLLRASR
ncbi:MAG TPA: beta-ketoacyl synthase N-terminal-like domain-containing protein [Casimicrobiaceae bacterium]|nr:beta-ketoacyl synthase N-terminal-like domain-containing protein [Casimicrobiaceae bacterium]